MYVAIFKNFLVNTHTHTQNDRRYECNMPRRPSLSLFIQPPPPLELNLEMRREVRYTVTVISLSRQMWYKFTDASALKLDTNFVPKSHLNLHIKRHFFYN